MLLRADGLLVWLKRQGASSLASSLDSALTLCGFGADMLGDEDCLLDDVLLPDEDLLDLAPDMPT